MELQMALSPPRTAAALPQVQGAKASPGMQKQSPPEQARRLGMALCMGCLPP